MDRRFFLFLVLALAAYIGTQYLVTLIWPPAKKPPAPPAREGEYGELAAGLGPMLVFPHGLPVPPSRTITAAAAEDLKHQQHLNQPGFLRATTSLFRRLHEEAEAAKLDNPLVMGGQGYKLRIEFSPRGAAVKSITFNEYFAADRATGKPVYLDKERTRPQPLTLVNDDWDGTLASLPTQQRLDRLSFRLLVPGVHLAWKTVEEECERDAQGQIRKLVFVAEAAEQNLRVKRVFELKPGHYHLDHILHFEPLDKARQLETSYVLTGPRGLPVEGEIWKQGPYWHVVIGTTKEDDRRSAYRHLIEPGKTYPVENPGVKPFKPAQPVDPYGSTPQALQYAGVLLQYFAALTIVAGDPTQNRWIEQVVPEGTGPNPTSDSRSQYAAPVSVRLVAHPLRVPPGHSASHTYLLYAGPAKVRLLHYEGGVPDELVDQYEHFYHLNNLTDYPWWMAMSYIGWTSLLVFFTNLMHTLLQWLSSLLYFLPMRYGFAIILITVLVRAAMFPISRKQAITAMKMQKLAPELKKLKEQYKDDRQAQTQAMMQLYRKHGVSPFGGCLVILMQMPIFLGMYYALNESVNLRLASFLWIGNLAAPDMLLYWGNWPLIGEITRLLNFGPYIHLLPILSIVLMLLHQKMFAPPAMDEQQAMQLKIMSYMMIFMGYLFYWIAAGLCVYFCVSSAWGLIERRLLPKVLHEPQAAVPSGNKPAPERGKTKPGGKQPAPLRLGWGKRLANWWSNLLEKAKKK